MSIQGESFVASYSANAKAGIATFNVSVADPGFYSLSAQCLAIGRGHHKLRQLLLQRRFRRLHGGKRRGGSAHRSVSGQRVVPPDDEWFGLCGDVVRGLGHVHSRPSVGSTLHRDAVPPGPADTNGVPTFNLSPGGVPKNIVLALRSDLVTKGIGQYKICWRSSNPFTPTRRDTCAFGRRHVHGLSPELQEERRGPCVLFKTSGQHNVAFFGILAPARRSTVYPNRSAFRHSPTDDRRIGSAPANERAVIPAPCRRPPPGSFGENSRAVAAETTLPFARRGPAPRPLRAPLHRACRPSGRT